MDPTFFYHGRPADLPTDGCYLLCSVFQVVFGEYIVDVMTLANKYGVADEGQLVSGQVRCMLFAARVLRCNRSLFEDMNRCKFRT